MAWQWHVHDYDRHRPDNLNPKMSSLPSYHIKFTLLYQPSLLRTLVIFQGTNNADAVHSVEVTVSVCRLPILRTISAPGENRHPSSHPVARLMSYQALRSILVVPTAR